MNKVRAGAYRLRNEMTLDEIEEAALFVRLGLSYEKAARIWGVTAKWLYKHLRGRV